MSKIELFNSFKKSKNQPNTLVKKSLIALFPRFVIQANKHLDSRSPLLYFVALSAHSNYTEIDNKLFENGVRVLLAFKQLSVDSPFPLFG
jgi:hypothetical protein